ncbi:MAG: AEC family transporter [Lachnospiraceae bacterium]|jgi:predicted permease|nr:AEC family transporter [Lachnospiraceae bacterium]
MEIILLKQICIMFLLIAVGILLVKKNYLSEQGGKDLGTILLRAVIPCVVIKSYITEYSPKRAGELAVAIGLALLALAVAFAVSYLFFGTRERIENFGAAFCNVGFIGIPLVQAVLGDGGVFYLAGFIALLNIFQWTYGVLIMTGDRNAIRLKTIVTNPVVISFVIGMLLFFLRIPVPQVVMSTLSNMANLNTPLAMIILGTYLAKMSWREIFTAKSAYVCVFVRLIVIPVATLLALLFIPGVNPEIKRVILIGCSTPVGSNIAIFAKQYEKDYKLSVVVVCLSTLLCIVTVPVFYMFVEKFI